METNLSTFPTLADEHKYTHDAAILWKYIAAVLDWRSKLYQELEYKLHTPTYEGEAFFAGEVLGLDEAVETEEDEKEETTGLDGWVVRRN